MSYQHYIGENGKCIAVAELDRGDQVRVTDHEGRVLEGEVTEVTSGSDHKNRVVRKFMADGQKAGLYVPVDGEGGFICVDMMFNGAKERVAVVEVDREDEG